MGDILAEAKDTMQTNYKCPIELRDPMVPKVFAVSKRAQEELPNFPQDLREAISLGRMALDPAVEVAQLFNQDDDVLCLQLSPFQTLLRKDKIKEGLKIALEEEMQYQMCEIGVDINKCVAYPHQGIFKIEIFFWCKKYFQHDVFNSLQVLVPERLTVSSSITKGQTRDLRLLIS